MQNLSELVKSSGMVTEQITSLLPESLQNLLNFLTLGEVLQISDDCGGMQLNIPLAINKKTIELLGNVVGNKMVKFYGGCGLYIPTCKELRFKLQVESVRKLRVKGWLINAIAREIGSSCRTVTKILNEAY
ncbi:MAG: hypothetical protein NTV00_12345 [Methylococcales bacterium]|nr:hypothetical protein [Methylococcales bacterium]